MGAYRPPSRHKDPPLNLGLDLPMEDVPFLDEDSEDSFGFEIGIDKANKKKLKIKKFTQEDSDDSFDRTNHPLQVEDMNDVMNSTGKRKIATAIAGPKGGSANKRNVMA